LKAKLGAMWR